MTIDLNKQIIFILDDEEDVTQLLKDYISKKLPDINVHVFNEYQNMVDHSLIKDCSLFIIDIELNSGVKGNEVADELFKNKFNKPYLFISGKDYDFESFKKYDYTYDFIKKPFDLNKLLNRIAVLLKVSKTYKTHETEEERLRYSLRELFDHTNIYVIILDDNMDIKSCSYALAKDLEYNDAEELLGLPWIDFITKEEAKKMNFIHQNVIDNTEAYQKSMREITTKLITKSGKTISVKWFNSKIKSGSSFSIGIPYNRKVTSADAIDSIRAYWSHVLDKDEAALLDLKNSKKG